MALADFPSKPELPPPPLRRMDPIDIDSLAILYIMLVHNNADFIARIIAALDEPQHTFIVHVDGKVIGVLSVNKYFQLYTLYLNAGVKANSLQDALMKRYRDKGINRNVFIMEDGRCRCNWGGFTIVNATINAMRYALTLDRHFDYCMDVSGTSYPIKSNEVR